MQRFEESQFGRPFNVLYAVLAVTMLPTQVDLIFHKRFDVFLVTCCNNVNL